VYADPDMAAATTGLVSALFGDFNYYVIRDVDGVQFQRLNELYAENGQVGFRAYHRTDGYLMNTAAIKKLTQA
jgi:HK97 family phage major capsid protein